jgi:hypothetical protein
VSLLTLSWRHHHLYYTPTSYSGGSGLESSHGHALYWLRFSVVSSVPPRECWDSTLQLGHGCFLPNPFQFIVHVWPFHSMLYSLSYWKSDVA